jgi:uncharacterized protein (DUF362 family)
VAEAKIEAVVSAVEEAISRVDGFAALPVDGLILLKVNCVSAFLIPGACTSPWLLDAVLALLRGRLPAAQLTVVDSDSSARRHLDCGCRLWGYDAICRRHGVELVNMARTGWTEVELPSAVLPRAQVSCKLLEAAAVVSLPVMKTHTWSGASISMKNMYGFYSPNRHNYHLFLDEAILAMQKRFPPALTVVDGTVGLEAGGPVMGHPRVAGRVVAGRNAVCTDAAVARFMGVAVPHVDAAMERLGAPAWSSVGDAAPCDPPFAAARQNLNSRMHYRLRHLPVHRVLFQTKFFHVLRWVSTLYQIYWYRTRGRRSRQAFFRSSPWVAQFPYTGHIYGGMRAR